jgi:hypothetical protein
MGESANTRKEALIIASLSIFFYSLVGCIAYYYYRKFSRLKNPNTLQAESLIGKYDHAKKLFFGILMVSSFLELPGYIGCIATDGPDECVWHSPSKVIFWFFHLLSLCGYACCIVIPCVLWSDMINKKDGKLFFSSYRYDRVKRYFQALLVLYFLNTIVYILLSAAHYRMSDRMAYRNSNPAYGICALDETIIIVLIAVGCLFCGIRLQVYVHRAKLNAVAELKFLFTLNIILFVIVLSFLSRAILNLGFAPGIPAVQNDVSYPVYTILTRWTPDIFCQLLLVYIMRLSGNEILTKNSNVIGHVSVGSGKGNGFMYNKSHSMAPLLGSDEYEPDSDELRASFQENILPVLKMAEKYNKDMKPNSDDAEIENNLLIRFSKSIEAQIDGFNSIDRTLLEASSVNGSDSMPVPQSCSSQGSSSANSRRHSNSAYLQSYDDNSLYSPPQTYIANSNVISPLIEKYRIQDDDDEL